MNYCNHKKTKLNPRFLKKIIAFLLLIFINLNILSIPDINSDISINQPLFSHLSVTNSDIPHSNAQSFAGIYHHHSNVSLFCNNSIYSMGIGNYTMVNPTNKIQTIKISFKTPQISSSEYPFKVTSSNPNVTIYSKIIYESTSPEFTISFPPFSNSTLLTQWYFNSYLEINSTNYLRNLQKKLWVASYQINGGEEWGQPIEWEEIHFYFLSDFFFCDSNQINIVQHSIPPDENSLIKHGISWYWFTLGSKTQNVSQSRNYLGHYWFREENFMKSFTTSVFNHITEMEIHIIGWGIIIGSFISISLISLVFTKKLIKKLKKTTKLQMELL